MSCGRNSNGLIRNNIIAYNTSVNIGGGIYCEDSNTIISNNLVIDNEAYSGGGIALYDSYSYLINNTIYNNIAIETGGGIYCDYIYFAELSNNILWANNAYTFNEIFIESGDSAIISYCDIQDTLWPGEGNISVDPRFRDSENGDYRLMSTACGDPFDSPCIDAGDPTIFDYLLDCDWGLGSERSDMGAYGGMAIPTDIRERERELKLPSGICLSQNYPNPFNSSSVINYSLPITSFVTVSIYNVLGQLEATIFEGIQQAGRQSITWNADDYPSGIYFARVEADERTGNVRMVLLK